MLEVRVGDYKLSRLDCFCIDPRTFKHRTQQADTHPFADGCHRVHRSRAGFAENCDRFAKIHEREDQRVDFLFGCFAQFLILDERIRGGEVFFSQRGFCTAGSESTFPCEASAAESNNKLVTPTSQK